VEKLSGQATKGFQFVICNASLIVALKLKPVPPSGQKVSQTLESFLLFTFKMIFFPKLQHLWQATFII